jgi:DNA-binding CsgD family transcriptional regulator
MIQQSISYGAHYAKDIHGKYLHADDLFLEISQIESINLIEATDREMPWAKTADMIIANDSMIVGKEMPSILIEHGTNRGTFSLFRSFKFPLKGFRGNILGVHGISLPISKSAGIPLSSQQQACLRLVALGHTHGQIAKELGLSQKTVEHYLCTVKNKLNCNDRSGLVQQAIERGLIGFIST